MLKGLTEALRNDPQLGPEFRAMEEIDEEAKRVLEFVELSVAFSPILISGDSTMDAVKVDYKGTNGKYVIREPFRMLTEDEVRLARARYLIVNGREQQPVIDRMFRKEAAV